MLHFLTRDLQTCVHQVAITTTGGGQKTLNQEQAIIDGHHAYVPILNRYKSDQTIVLKIAKLEICMANFNFMNSGLFLKSVLL